MGAQDVAVGLVTVTFHHFLQSVCDNFLGCIRSLALDSSHPLLESTCTHLGRYHMLIFNLYKEMKHMLLLFQHERKRLLVASCLSCL